MKSWKSSSKTLSQVFVFISLGLLANSLYQPAFVAAHDLRLYSKSVGASKEDNPTILQPDDGRSPTQGAGDADAVDFSGPEREGNRFGGERRTGDEACPDIGNGQPLTALIPVTNYGQTTKRLPTLWFYVPYTAEQVVRGEFSIQNADGNIVGPISFSIPAGGPGLVSFTFPEAFALENIGTEYQWFFDLYCGSGNSPDKSVYGWIERVNLLPESQDDPNQSQLPEDTILANQGIWFDAVHSLATLRLETGSNTDLNIRWNSLMTAIGVPESETPEVPLIDSEVPLIGDIKLDMPESLTESEANVELEP